MNAFLGLLMAAMVGLDEAPAKASRPPVPVSRPGAIQKTATKKEGPVVAFEIREIRAGSPDWRAKLMPRLRTVARHEGTAAWLLDQAGYQELIEYLQDDPHSNLLQAPKLTAHVGDPARMTNEETVQYVAALKRETQGPPNQPTGLAFVPQVDKIHSGVRVSILSSQINGSSLQARVVIEENRLLAFHTTTYREEVVPKSDPEVAQASFLSRLNPNHGPHAAGITGTIQVPEVDSRRIEGYWLIPSDGALLVSLGPRGGQEKGLIKKAYTEHLIAITARVDSAAANSPAPSAAAPSASTPR